MTKFFTIILLFLGFESIATSTEWYEGAIVLADDKVRRGEIAVHALFNLVAFRSGEDVIVYPAHKVSSIFFYDHKKNINRRFVSIGMKKPAAGFLTYQLFEIVVKGDISVVRRYKGFLFDQHADADSYAYFIIHNNEEIPLRQFRKKVYPDLIDYDKESIRAYMARENLNPCKRADAIRLIEFYNALVNKSVTRLANLK